MKNFVIAFLILLLIAAKSTPKSVEVRSPNGEYAIKLLATDNGCYIEKHEPSIRKDGVTVVTLIDAGDTRRYYIFPRGFTEAQKAPYEGF